jgi:SAM-dependent methyltransferase
MPDMIDLSQDQKLPVATPEKLEYCGSWASNAENLVCQGAYTWMADQLLEVNPRRVLDFGCGTGEGIIALYRHYASQIVSLEENSQCIRVAEKALAAGGITEIETPIRLGYVEYSDGTHDMALDQSVPIHATPPVTIIHADALGDDLLLSDFLRSEPPYDAVTIWLAGTFRGRRTCRYITKMGITNPELYRIAVQNRAYEIAGKVLRSGGWLQVVDRTEPIADDALAEDLLSHHREQAEGTGVEVFRWSQLPYVEVKERGIRIVGAASAAGHPQPANWVLASVLSRKP